MVHLTGSLGRATYNLRSISPVQKTTLVSSALAANTPDSSQQSAFEQELAALMVQALNLEVAPSEIDPTAQLYGDGLGLDSIDILELALEVSQRYGMDLRSDDEDNVRIFQSLRSLAAHITAHRTK